MADTGTSVQRISWASRPELLRGGRRRAFAVGRDEQLATREADLQYPAEHGARGPKRDAADSRQVEQSANFPLPDDFFIDITFDGWTSGPWTSTLPCLRTR